VCFMVSDVYSARLSQKCKLHPLIHTRPDFTGAQDVEKKKAEPKTPHFLSLNQDIVAQSQEEKCGVCNLHFGEIKLTMDIFSH
jgi:hypothetical protein